MGLMKPTYDELKELSHQAEESAEHSIRLARRVLLGAASAIIISLLLWAFMNIGSAPHDTVTPVPLGSKLSELDRYLHRGAGSEGKVTQWIPARITAGNPVYNEFYKEFGMFIPKKLGSYDEWKASSEERDKFTGEIQFIHWSSTSDDVNTFIYINGKLLKKDWGFLPG